MRLPAGGATAATAAAAERRGAIGRGSLGRGGRGVNHQSETACHHSQVPAITGCATFTRMKWADEFQDIPEVIAARPDLRAAMRFLLEHHEIPVKVTEGGD